MALARARRGDSGMNYWPGFVDALSTLVLSIVFLLSVFLVVQFFLSQEVTGKDKEITSRVYDELMPMFSDTGRFDPAALATLRKSYVELNLLPAEPDMAKLYNEAFLPK